MAIAKYIRGTILEGGSASAGLVVKLGARSGRAISPITETTTDQAGRFCFDVSAYTATSGGGKRFRLDVFSGATQLQAQGDVSLSSSVDLEGLVIEATRPAPVAAVTDDPPEDLQDFSDEAIHGVVRHKDGVGLEGLVVKLFRRAWSDLSALEPPPPLDTTETLSEGWFCFDALAQTGFPLSLEVWKPQVEGQPPPTVPIGRSRVVYDYTGGPLRIDVEIKDSSLRRVSEYERLSLALSNAIFPESGSHPAPGLGDALAALGPKQAAWLEGQTGWSMERITERALAEKWSASLSDLETPLAPEAVYALLRQGLIGSGGGLLGQAPSRVRSAINAAVTTNLVSPSLSSEQVLAGLQASILKKRVSSDEDSLASILGASHAVNPAGGLSEAQVTALCALQASFSGTDEAFWSAAMALGPFSGQPDDPALLEAKRMVRLGSVALGHAPTMMGILAELGSSPAEETVTWDSAQWATVAALVNPLPSDLPGDNDTERRESLAMLLKEHAELSFPAAAICAGLSKSGSPFGQEAWFNWDYSIDLRSIRLEAGDPEELHVAQRLCRVAPSLSIAPAMERLFTLGFRSARDIARKGRARFLQGWAAEDDTAARDEAIEIFRKAQSQSGLAAAFLLQAHPALGRAPVGFLPAAPLDGLDLPANWSSLFGSASTGSGDYIEPPGTRGDWCSSIHGPSAYLVDLLDWLSDKGSWSLSTPASETALSLFADRRPDILKLPLTCPNATRSLPYVDLVLEVLEDVVAEGSAAEISPHSSDVESEEMLAAPQHINLDAYGQDKLGGAWKSFLTPFHQPLHEARAFLGHLGIDRTDLMRLFLDLPVVLEDEPGELDIACEELGLSTEAADAIISSEAEADFWSLPTLTTVPTLRDLRRAAGVSYTDVLDLVHARAVNGLGPLAVGMGRDDDPFEESSYVLHASGSAPSTEQFCAIRRMIRLWRATGWSLLETDKVLHALGSLSISLWGTECLSWVAELHRLGRITELEPTVLAAWFADIDTFLDRDTADAPVQSLYDRVFLNPAVFPSSESQDSSFPFRLNEEERDELLATNPATTVEQALERLRSVLGQDESELRALLTDLHGNAWGNLSLALLSELYRWCSLARFLGLKPTEAWRLARCMGRESATSSPLGWVFASPSSAIEFLDHARRSGEAGWSVDELDYLLLHEASERVAPTDERIQGILGRIRDAVLAQDTGASEAARAEALRDQLATELGISRRFAADLDERMWIGAAPEEKEAVLPCFLVSALRYQPGEGTLELEAELTITLTEAADVVKNSGNETLPVGTTVVVALGSAVEAIILHAGTPCVFVSEGEIAIDEDLAVGTRFEFAAGVLVTVGGATLALATTALGSISTAMELALGDIPLDSVSNAGSLCARFLGAPYTTTEAAPGTNPWANILRNDSAGNWFREFAVIEALLKAVLFDSKLGADDEERQALRDTSLDWDLLDPAILLCAPTERRMLDHSLAFERLLRAIDLFVQRQRLPGSSPTFAELILAPSVSNIADRTGWDLTTLEGFVPDTVNSVSQLESLLSWMAYHRKTGATPEVLASWCVPGSLDAFTDTTSRTVIAAARSRTTTPQAWAGVARPIRDRVRKAQRDALVSYLIAESGGTIQDADALYEHLLIDVSMNPEMLTSRVVQAACSVQLFVHRALFGLEDADTCRCFNDEDRDEWEWMKSYRVWEAARKVLLYPENWIEPELRDDKSGFFETLEKDLAQGDLGEDRVGTLAVEYLDRLAEVANLEVLAYYVERESDSDGAIDRLHVFARTRADPPAYWYRRRDDGLTWTPWEKVEVGIEGKHLIPVVWERRLLLFWAEFTEVQSDDCQNENPNPPRWWEIRLAMSERQDGHWSPKVVYSEVLSTQERSYLHYSNDTYAFVVAQDGEVLTVTCLVSEYRTRSEEFSFTELGQYEIDPLAASLVTRHAVEYTSVERLSLGQSGWSAPGYLTSGIHQGGVLSIFHGDTDPDGYLEGTASLVNLLGTCVDAVVVLPCQWEDYVSQAPFFVVQRDRVWLAEPISSVNLTVSASLAGTNPSLSGLALRREGTSPSGAFSQDLDDVMTEDQAEDLTSYLSRTSDLSKEDQTSRTRDSAMRMAAGAYEAGVIEIPACFRFRHFHHPFVAELRKEVRRNGIFGLLSPNPNGEARELFRQRMTGDENSFDETYSPTDRVETPLPQDEIDFSESGSYSCYNWELFFHLPFLMAKRLSDEGRYEDAIRYYHAIFDPRTRTPATDDAPDPTSVAQWWRLKPFLDPVSEPVTNWIAFTGGDGDVNAQEAFERQVDAWREDPFNPHLLARMRPGVYQRAIVMAYLDTLLAWGDHLFARDTLESLNEATQLYVYARRVLGDRPALFEQTTAPAARCYEQLAESEDAGGNALVALENACFSPRGFGVTSHVGAVALRGLQRVVYFNVPYNAKLLSYWDTVEDRLFKIRNGMNLEGVVRSLPLFSPPIDPSLLVRAAAAGLDIGSILDDLSGTPGPYRFTVMHGRAQALAGTVRALGQALLSALEKRDGEALALLRQEHEAALLDAVKEVRTRQVDEALASFQAARRSRKLAVARKEYYERLIEKGPIEAEMSMLSHSTAADVYGLMGATYSSIGAISGLFPDISVGLAAAATSGGNNAANVANAYASVYNLLATASRGSASNSSTWATWTRRTQEWKHQKKQAIKEIDQIDKQIEAAKIRLEIAKRELTNHELQVQHSAEIREWMESKYTNQELYDWMVGQLCALHFQAWQLACSVAKKAERCFNFELGYSDSSSLSFVRSDNWDASRRGLLAGERLALDLDRMDAAWLDRDEREHELVKHVSLSLLDPLAVERLKVDGECYFEIPEAAFDLDCPSHYLRRIQSVALSIACVAGPQSNVNARLTLHGSSVRRSASGAIEEESCTNPSIVTSVATQDSGLFQADLKDPRYLPFERLGAISRWHLELTAREIPQLDWASIEDVTLHLRYTARDGRSVETTDLEMLKVGVDETFSSDSAGFVRLVSLKRDFPDELALAQDGNEPTVTVTVGPELLWPAGAEGTSLTLSGTIAVVSVLDEHATPTAINEDSISGNNYVALTSHPPTFSGEETFSLTDAVFSDLDDLVLILLYRWSTS